MADKQNKNGNGALLGFEETLWKAADKLRNNMDAAEYKHVVLGLIFLAPRHQYPISKWRAELHDANGGLLEGSYNSPLRKTDLYP